MHLPWLVRFGVVCGVLEAILSGVPAAVEAFTGETAPTSFLIALSPALAPPALTALYLCQRAAAGRFGAIAYAVNIIGVGLFGGAVFTLNMVLFYLDEATVAALMSGPTRVGVLGTSIIFVLGCVLFSISMVRTRILPPVPAWGYGIGAALLALLAPLPDTPFTSAVHLVVSGSVLWLSLSMWSRARAAAGSSSPGTAAILPS